MHSPGPVANEMTKTRTRMMAAYDAHWYGFSAIVAAVAAVTPAFVAASTTGDLPDCTH